MHHSEIEEKYQEYYDLVHRDTPDNWDSGTELLFLKELKSDIQEYHSKYHRYMLSDMSGAFRYMLQLLDWRIFIAYDRVTRQKHE